MLVSDGISWLQITDHSGSCMWMHIALVHARFSLPLTVGQFCHMAWKQPLVTKNGEDFGVCTPLSSSICRIWCNNFVDKSAVRCKMLGPRVQSAEQTLNQNTLGWLEHVLRTPRERLTDSLCAALRNNY